MRIATVKIRYNDLPNCQLLLDSTVCGAKGGSILAEDTGCALENMEGRKGHNSVLYFSCNSNIYIFVFIFVTFIIRLNN